MKAARLLLGALGLLSPWCSHAGLIEQGLTASLSEDYDTNPPMSSAGSTALWRTSLSPSYSLSRASGADEWDASLGLLLQRSSDPGVSQNRQDPSLSLGWTRATPNGSFGFSAGYKKASTRITELQDTGLVAADGSQTTQSLSGNWSNALDERRTVSLNAAYAGVGYQGGTLSDYRNFSVGATGSYAWDERSEPYLSLSASRYQPVNTTGIESDSYDLMAGVKLSRSDRLSLELAGGVNQLLAQTTQSGFVGSVKLNYALDDREDFNFNLSRGVAASGIGGFLKSDQFSAGWSRALSDRQSLGADLSWHWSHSAGTGDTRQLSLWSSRVLDDLWSLRFSYLYKQLSGGSLAEASGHVLSLTLSYAHPDLF